LARKTPALIGGSVPTAAPPECTTAADSCTGTTNPADFNLGYSSTFVHLATRFVADADETICKINLYLKKTGSPTFTLTANIYTDSSNHPGTSLGPASASVAAVVRSNVIRFEPPLLERLAEQVPAFGLEVARVLAERLERAVGQIPIPEADAALVAQGGLLDLLPRDLMTRLRAVPLVLRGQLLTVGLNDEPSPELFERLRAHLPGMELRPVP
jgi:hypothetical protein